MTWRGLYPSAAFLLVLLVATYGLLIRDSVLLGGSRGAPEPRQWVYLSDPEHGAGFHSFEPGQLLVQLVDRRLPQLSDQLSDGCEQIVLAPGTRIDLQIGGGAEERICSVLPVSERCRYLLGMPLNVNRAGAEELVLLPGIGPRLAERIIETRRSAGGFSSPDDILQVRGIGEKVLQKMQGRICY
jgi:competence ComEA-like helix-hairpin-helix protein